MNKKIALVLLVSLLSVCLNAQTKKPVRKPARTTASTSVKKTRKEEKDGFIWYLLQKGNLYGAADLNGKTIIPIQYDRVIYYESIAYYTHYFKVQKGDYEGAYSPLGDLVISTDREYTSVCPFARSFNDSYVLGWRVRKNAGYTGFLDAKGNVVIEPVRGLELISFGTEIKGTSKAVYIDGVDYKDRNCAWDLDGNLVIPFSKNYYSMCVYDGTFIVSDVNGECKEIEMPYFSQASIARYLAWGDMCWEFEPRESASSETTSSTSSSSGTSSTTTSNSSSRTETTTHREPERRQVWKERWRPCISCDRGKCRQCYGRGGYYIGNYYNTCGVCSGTGVCLICVGRGEVMETYQTWE